MNLKIEEILKREDGSRVKIVVELFEPSHRTFEYRFHVYTCKKGKRTWMGLVDSNNYSYRTLGMKECREFEIAESMKIITDDELLNAKLSLWESLKPKI
ncbi:MAG: hypothetical protein KAT90_03850 [Gammaproteobacteria bacterium]|nr:hypothetical protein [Gammaproteobacteria bacterium]